MGAGHVLLASCLYTQYCGSAIRLGLALPSAALHASSSTYPSLAAVKANCATSAWLHTCMSRKACMIHMLHAPSQCKLPAALQMHEHDMMEVSPPSVWP